MKKLFSGIKWFEDTLTSAFLSIVVLITLANVVARYVLIASITWAQEISGFFWTWTVMIGMSVGYRRNLHYGVDFLVAKLPKKYANVLKRIVYFLMLLTCVFMLYLSISITSQGFIKVSAYFGIPYFYKYISAVIGFALMLIHTLRYLVISFRDPDNFFQRIAQGGLPGLDNEDDDIDDLTTKGGDEARWPHFL
uniref:TRAP transporter small permease n=1 Tax=Segatella hominis TaxID=2518605 RepID=UPI004038898A